MHPASSQQRWWESSKSTIKALPVLQALKALWMASCAAQGNPGRGHLLFLFYRRKYSDWKECDQGHHLLSGPTGVWTQPFWRWGLKVLASVASHLVQPFNLASRDCAWGVGKLGSNPSLPWPAVRVKPWANSSFRAPPSSGRSFPTHPLGGWQLPPFASNQICQATSNQKKATLYNKKMCFASPAWRYSRSTTTTENS